MRSQSITSVLVFGMMLATAAMAQTPNTGAAVDLGLDPTALPTEVKDFEGQVRGLWRDGRVLIAGQPEEPTFSRFRELGVTVVVNLRSDAEMADRARVPFDEAAVVEGLDMEYVHVPLGGDEHPYTTEAVERFAAVLQRHKGTVLLHCTVAWRASYLWSAYLIRYHGFELDDALARGEAIAISPPPIAGMLGRPVKLVFADEPIAKPAD